MNKDDNKATITVAALKAELQKAFDAGKAEGWREGREGDGGKPDFMKGLFR